MANARALAKECVHGPMPCHGMSHPRVCRDARSPHPWLVSLSPSRFFHAMACATRCPCTWCASRSPVARRVVDCTAEGVPGWHVHDCHVDA